MRKVSALVLSAIVAISTFVGCDRNPKNEKETLTPIVVGVSEYEPYYFKNEDGDICGVDVDLCREAFERLGYSPIFREIVWKEKEEWLKKGSVDCIWACFSMNGREDEFDWAGPYAKDRQVVAVLKKSNLYSLSDLENKKVSVQMNSLPEDVFLSHTGNAPNVESVFSLYDMGEMVSSLRREYVDACVGHEAAVINALEDAGVEYRILPEALVVSETGVAFLKDDDTGVCEKLDECLEEMKKDGTIEKIYQSYGMNSGANN